MSRSQRTIFVGGLSPSTRTSDLARNFDRFGKLSRCDIPTPGGRPKGYAFIEFEDDRDAEDAFEAMKYKRIDGRDVTVQWAKREPAPGWRFSSQGREGRDRPRSRSPRKRRHSRSRLVFLFIIIILLLYFLIDYLF